MAEHSIEARLTYFGDGLTVGDLRTFISRLKLADDSEEINVEIDPHVGMFSLSGVMSTPDTEEGR